MFRDVAAYRHLIEVSWSGLPEEEKVISAFLSDHRDAFEADGIRFDVVRRGVVPRQILITVGRGAELHAVRLVHALERTLAAGDVQVYVHPHCLPRPMFFLLPKEAEEARQHLRLAASAFETPVEKLKRPTPWETAGAVAGSGEGIARAG